MKIVLLWTATNTINYIMAGYCASRTLTKKFKTLTTWFIWLLSVAFAFGAMFVNYSINLYNDTIPQVIQAVVLCFTLCLLYCEIWESKLFLGLTATLFTSVLTFMFCGTTDQIWGTKLELFDEVAGPYTVRNIMFFGAVKIAVQSFFAFIYIKTLLPQTRTLIIQSKKMMRKYLISPIVTLIGFSVITYVTNAIGIFPTNKYFLPLYIVICSIFLVEYEQIFTSVKWAIAANKEKRLGHMDGLTGLYNRLAFDEIEAKCNKAIEEHDADFSIVMIDLNFLKTINDKYGHDKGDIALKKLSDYINIVFADYDCFRVGGDEFVVYIPDKKFSEVEKLSLELKKLIDNDNHKEEWLHISAAIGYALYDRDIDSDFQSVFKRADDHMYDNKNKIKKMMGAE